MIHKASEVEKVIAALFPQIVVNTTVNGAGVKVLGHETAMLVVNAGDVPAGATLVVKIQSSSDNGAVDAYADLAGATTVTIAPADDDEIYLIDVNLSETEAWLRAVATAVGAALNVFVAAEFHLFEGREQPPVQENIVASFGFS